MPAEKGYGECPDYDATQSVYSITCKGVDVTSKFSQEEQDALAEEIAKKGIEEGKEKKMEYALSMREAA